MTIQKAYYRGKKFTPFKLNNNSPFFNESSFGKSTEYLLRPLKKNVCLILTYCIISNDFFQLEVNNLYLCWVCPKEWSVFIVYANKTNEKCLK